MDERILNVMRAALDDNSLDQSCSQDNCDKWDSIHHLSLISDLEDEFNVEFEPEEIAQMRDFSKVKEIVLSKL